LFVPFKFAFQLLIHNNSLTHYAKGTPISFGCFYPFISSSFHSCCLPLLTPPRLAHFRRRLGRLSLHYLHGAIALWVRGVEFRFFSIFPRGTYSLSIIERYFLVRGSIPFIPFFFFYLFSYLLLPQCTSYTVLRRYASRSIYGGFTLFLLSTLTTRALECKFHIYSPRVLCTRGLGFHSPLLSDSLLISFPLIN